MSGSILCLYNFQHVQSLFAALAVQKYFGVSNVVMEASNYRANSVARRHGDIAAIVVIGMGYTFETFPEFRYVVETTP